MCNRIRHEGGDWGHTPSVFFPAKLQVSLDHATHWFSICGSWSPFSRSLYDNSGASNYDSDTDSKGADCLELTYFHPSTWNDMARSSCHQPGFPDGILLSLPRESLFFEYKELFFILRPFLLNLLLLIFKFIYFQLEDNCLTILCWFLPYSNMNQP